MDLFNGLSSDQTAMLGCAAALLVSGTVMSLSYYVGRYFHSSEQAPEPTEPHTLKMPDPAMLRSKPAPNTASHHQSEPNPAIRRAA